MKNNKDFFRNAVLLPPTRQPRRSKYEPVKTREHLADNLADRIADIEGVTGDFDEIRHLLLHTEEGLLKADEELLRELEAITDSYAEYWMQKIHKYIQKKMEKPT